MELRQYLYLVWQWLWLIVLGTAVAGGVAYYISRNQAPVYRATSILLVIEGSDAIDTAYNSILTSERLASSYSQRLKNHEVLTQALHNLQLEMNVTDLAKTIQVQLVGNTQLISLHVEHTDPQIARDLANEIPSVFAKRNMAQQLSQYADLKASLQDELAELSAELTSAEAALATETRKAIPDQAVVDQINENIRRLRDTYGRLSASYEDVRIAEVRRLSDLVIDDMARLPVEPVRPRVLTNTILAAVVGAMLTIGLIFLVEYLDDTIKTPLDVENGLGLTALGTVQQVKISQPADALVVAMEPRSPAAESYRHLRTNIQYVSVDRPARTLLVTSANMGEGKTTVSTNLAISLAQSGKRVLLVDTDMRRPMLHRLLEVQGGKGLCELIIRGREDASLIKSTLVPNLRLLPAGRLPPNPAELLGSERMREVLVWLQTQADYLIFDSPPVLAVTDAVVLSQLVDTTIFVVRANRTRFPTLLTAVKQIEAVEQPIAGMILNCVPVNGRFYHAYGYYARQSYHPTEEQNGRKTWRERLSASNRSA